MKSCHVGNRDFLCVRAHTRVCAQAGACTQTHAHSHLRYRSSGKGLFPYVSSKEEQKQGERAVLSHSHTVLLRSNLKDNQHRQQSPIFPQVLSSLSPHLRAPSGRKAGPPLSLHCSDDNAMGYRGGGWCLQSLGCGERILKGCSRWHQDLLILFCWVINITTLLQTWVCFVISSSHPKQICWAISRYREKGCDQFSGLLI